jgi:hypothetical protein
MVHRFFDVKQNDENRKDHIEGGWSFLFLENTGKRLSKGLSFIILNNNDRNDRKDEISGKNR